MNAIRFKIILTAAVGNAVEWYDYAVYGSLSVILSRLFFPLEDSRVAFINTLAIFALGFIMRPIGGIFFGYLGHRFGLAKTWLSSIIIMALPTLIIGVLPTYNQIGFLAPLMLLVARLFQGFAIGGEFPSALLLIKNISPTNQEGLSTSFVVASIFLGFILGTLACLMSVSLLSSSQLHQWGWRLPFLLSSVIAAVLIYIRSRISLPEHTKKITAKPFNLLKILKGHHQKMLLTASIYALPAVAFYVAIVFLPAFIEHGKQLRLDQSLYLNILMMVLLLLSSIVGGYLADKYSRKLILIISGIVIITSNLIGFYFLSTNALILAFPWLMLFAVALGIYYGVAAITMITLFVADSKLTGVAFAHGITFAMIGGSAPLIVSLMSHWMSSLMAAAIYIMFVGVLSILLLGFYLPANKTVQCEQRNKGKIRC